MILKRLFNQFVASPKIFRLVVALVDVVRVIKSLPVRQERLARRLQEPTPAPGGAKPEAPPAPPMREIKLRLRRGSPAALAQQQVVDKIVARLFALADIASPAARPAIEAVARVVRDEFP